MPKAMSNIDTLFIENLTAMTLYQKEWCELLAESICNPKERQILENIYNKAEKIRISAIHQRDYIRSWKQEMRKQEKQAGAR